MDTPRSPRPLIDDRLVVPSAGGPATELLGTWYHPGWRVRAVSDSAPAAGEARLRLQWLSAPARFRVFFGPNQAFDGRMVGDHRIDWANGTRWYKDSPLAGAEWRIYSQNGEDGVLLALLDALDVRAPVALEFGVQDGNECNTRILAAQGHAVLQWDRDYHNPTRGLYRELVTTANLPQLVDRYRVQRDLDVLSIDVDYYDFYFWWRIAELLSPRIVIIEYNAAHGPDEDLVVLHEGHDKGWDGSRYFGASLLALTRLGDRLGYTLVYADAAGVNAFFVRRDQLDRVRRLAPRAGDIRRIWRPAGYGNGGHPPDPLHRRYTSAEALLGAPRAPWDPG
jgi:hypothetical protein